MDSNEDQPTVLACGCPEPIVRDEGHQEGCRFEGQGPQDYPWITEYGTYLGMPAGLIQELVARARRDEAPLDAFWFWLRRGKERWLIVPEMSTLTRARLGLPPHSG